MHSIVTRLIPLTNHVGKKFNQSEVVLLPKIAEYNNYAASPYAEYLQSGEFSFHLCV